jgi:hypothetical protein
MKLVPLKREDLPTEIGKRSRIIRLTVDRSKTTTKELSQVSIGELVLSMEEPKDNEFYFRVEGEVSVNV